MLNEKQKILFKKRIAELNCLSINPVLYYNVCKFINKRVYVVVKDYKLYMFPIEAAKKLGRDKTGGQTKYVHKDELAETIVRAYGIQDDQLVLAIINEWRREKIIESNMSLDVEEYWDYLSLPMSAKEVDDFDEYNF